VATMRLYFTEHIDTHPKFRTEMIKQKDRDEKVPYDYFMDVKVFIEAGRFFASVDSDFDIPDEMRAYVVSVSLQFSFLRHPHRETGVYKGEERFGDAETELDHSSSNYYGRIRSSDPENAKALLRAIRAGTIRPCESWEAEQGSPSQPELVEELARLQNTNGRMRENTQHDIESIERLRSENDAVRLENEGLKRTREERIAELEQQNGERSDLLAIIIELCEDGFPLIRKSVVIEALAHYRRKYFE